MSLIVLLSGVLLAITKRRDFLWYQLILLSAFLVALTLSGELGGTMPIYAVAALFPCVLQCKKYDFSTIIYCLAMVIYLLIGLIQSPVNAITTFICRIAQFLGLIFVIGCQYEKVTSRTMERVVLTGLAVEVALAIYLVFNGSVAFGGTVEGIRLVSNSQPITGNLAIALLPLMGYLFFQSYPFDGVRRLRILVYATCFLVLTVVSGTRGYVLLFGLCFAVMAFFYFWDAANGRYRSYAPILIICFIGVFACILIGLFQKELVNLIVDTLRIDESLGIRDYENAVVQQTFAGQPLGNQLFGIGIGGRWSDSPAFVEAAWEIFPDWALPKYTDAIGTAMHNFFANVLILQGLFGLLLLIVFLWWLLRKIEATSCATKAMKVFLYAFTVGYVAMLYFRWSADCGIGVLVFFGFVLRLLYRPENAALRHDNSASTD